MRNDTGFWNIGTIKKFFIITLYLCIPLIAIIFYPVSSNHILRTNYIVDAVSLQISLSILLVHYIKNKLSILEPIVFISFLYIIMFFVNPMFDIVTGDILWFGVDLFGYGIKATWIALLGYVLFSIGYYYKLFPSRYFMRYHGFKKTDITANRVITYRSDYIGKLSMILWVISFIISFIYLLYSGGQSFRYIITFGLGGSIKEGIKTSTPLGVLSMFSYSIIPTCLMYFEYGKSKSIKLLMIFLTFMVQMMRGFRFIILVFLGAFILYYYLKNKKKPTIKMVICVILITFLISGWVGYIRNDIRYGSRINWNWFDIKMIWESILENFQIYKTYYGVIKAVPALTPYLYGRQIFLYTLVMMIPRALWPGKPEGGGGGKAIIYGVNQAAGNSGTAYPNLGEYYVEFGIIGVILFMLLYGILMRRLKSYLESHEKDYLSLMVYAILLPANLQVIIRGMLASNLYLILFLVMPVVIVKKLCLLYGKYQLE